MTTNKYTPAFEAYFEETYPSYEGENKLTRLTAKDIAFHAWQSALSSVKAPFVVMTLTGCRGRCDTVAIDLFDSPDDVCSHVVSNTHDDGKYWSESSIIDSGDAIELYKGVLL